MLNIRSRKKSYLPFLQKILINHYTIRLGLLRNQMPFRFLVALISAMDIPTMILFIIPNRSSIFSDQADCILWCSSKMMTDRLLDMLRLKCRQTAPILANKGSGLSFQDTGEVMALRPF